MSRLPAEEKVHELVSAYRRGDFPGAERLARGFTRKWPAHDLGWNILSASLHALGKLDKAANAYRRAIALNPRYAELRDNYGALLIQQGALEDAGAQFREAVRLDPGSGRSRANL
ncbi:MAG TPA: tetratricopeptide repeat protein, partial [Arenicellales bacterium]|nr:tetratricopeptide repeat protein [Arenicellales bacterium]